MEVSDESETDCSQFAGFHYSGRFDRCLRADTNAYADANAYTNTNANTDANVHINTHADANTHPNTDTHPSPARPGWHPGSSPCCPYLPGKR